GVHFASRTEMRACSSTAVSRWMLDPFAPASHSRLPAFEPLVLDLLAIAAHPDDVELTCGGTLAKAARQGYRVGVLDLSAGEMGTRGTVATRRAEAERAAGVIGLTLRENLGMPDAGIVNTPETRLAVGRVLRRLKPTVVIAPAPPPYGRHPDHRATSELV